MLPISTTAASLTNKDHEIDVCQQENLHHLFYCDVFVGFSALVLVYYISSDLECGILVAKYLEVYCWII